MEDNYDRCATLARHGLEVKRHTGHRIRWLQPRALVWNPVGILGYSTNQ
jgi:hypothetical protein